MIDLVGKVTKRGEYEILYADFPWPYTSFGTATLPYKPMTEEEISEFDLSRFRASRCVMFSWATWPKLDIAMRCGEHWAARHGLCSDFYRTGFSAVNISSGKRVEGAVCCGLFFKGCTVRH